MIALETALDLYNLVNEALLEIYGHESNFPSDFKERLEDFMETIHAVK